MGIKIYRGIVLGLLVFIAWQLLQIKVIELQGFNILYSILTAGQ